jgi:hypothetical protein
MENNLLYGATSKSSLMQFLLENCMSKGEKYGTVFGSGQSMGALGTSIYGPSVPNVFSRIY